MPVAILAGGLATRLGGLTRATPKSLLPVAGRPFIDWQLGLLAAGGITDIVLCLGHLGGQIEAHVSDGAAWGVRVAYSREGESLLGTGGALKKALPLLGDSFMALYGDSYLEADYGAVADAFGRSGQPALMTVFRNEGRYDASNAVYEAGRVVDYGKGGHDPRRRYIDYGLGCLSSGVLASWPAEAFDLADVYARLAREGRLAGREVFTRFYEIGSAAGLAELGKVLAAKEA